MDKFGKIIFVLAKTFYVFLILATVFMLYLYWNESRLAVETKDRLLIGAAITFVMAIIMRYLIRIGKE